MTDTRKLIEEQIAALRRQADSHAVMRGKWNVEWAAALFAGAAALEASLPTEDEEITNEALWDFAGDLLDAWNIEDANPPSMIEDFRDRFTARFRRSPVPPETDDQAARDEAEKRWPDASIHSGREWRKQAFLEGAEWQKSRAAVPPETDDATRVLAQHAYDGLTSLDLSGKMTREGTAWGAILREAIDDLAAILAAVPPVTEEPEWEYGLVNPEAEFGEFGRDDRAHLVSSNREHIEKQWRRGHPSIQFVKRVKAGPWVPVKGTEQ